jgi:fructose transport system permease protein
MTDSLQAAGEEASTVPDTTGTRAATITDRIFRNPVLGPLGALIILVIGFSIFTQNFLSVDNTSLILQQSVVVGTLALGQTIIILTAGIDLANAANTVLATLLMAKLVVGGAPAWLALLVGIAAAVLIGALTGVLVTNVKLPPFIVTLGLLTILTAVSRIYTGESVPVSDSLLSWLGTRRYLFGGIEVTYGMTVALLMFLIVWYALNKTGWGKHVYAVGNEPEAARLSGINVRRTVIGVYVIAGLIYGIAAWQALGRVPNADPNAYQTANLDSITAVVIGGTSLFGGRGSVLGTLVGALIVTVLRSGLTQAGIDDLYQNVATGILVIAAVALDRFTRGRQR